MGEKDKKSKKEPKVAVAPKDSPDYMIQPTKVTPPLDTSKWPLLLKVCAFDLLVSCVCAWQGTLACAQSSRKPFCSKRVI